MLKVLRVGEPQRAARINTPRRAVNYWNAVIKRQPWFDDSKENMVVLVLSTKYEIQGWSLVSIGSLSESIAHPREIFRAAIACGGYAIAVLHNHPSGNSNPSRADRAVASRLSEAGELLAIQVADFIIVGKKGTYFSLREEQDAKRRRRMRR